MSALRGACGAFCTGIENTTSVMHNQSQGNNCETLICIPCRDFQLNPEQVVFYDPNPTSEFSLYIESHLDEIKDWFKENNHEFCYVPDIQVHISDEQIRYLFPNWEGTVESLGSNVLKSWLADNNKDIGAGFLRLDDCNTMSFKYFPLISLAKKSWENQLDLYKPLLLEKHTTVDHVLFSVTGHEGDDKLYSVYEKKLSFADENFSEHTISDEIKRIVEQLHKEGFEEFVLRCMVPIEEKLSRVVITSMYEIILPDYGNLHIEMSPLPKAVFLLFLKHPEGLYFKDLVDYKDELRDIYGIITNRTSPMVIDDSIDKITDPTQNAINEKCSRIREAFVEHMDERLAKNYCITGLRGEAKRITLPRVEWR